MKIKEEGAVSDAGELDPQFPPGHPPSVPYHWTANKMAELVDVINTSLVQDNKSLASYNTSLALHNTSQDSLLPGERDEALAQVEVAILATILTLAVGGNSCVLVALARRRKIASRMHMFILHLSVADLLVAFFNILPQLLWDISGTFHGGDFLCRLVKFLQVFVMYLSTYVLVMTAVDRYRAICHPLSNYNWSQRTVNILIGAIYFLSAVLSLPQPLLFKYQVVPGSDHYDCWADFSPPWLLKFYILSFTLAVYIVPFFILVFAYGSICFTIWAKQPRSAAEEDAGCRQEETSHLKSADGHGVHNHVDPRASPLLSLPTTPGGRGGHMSHNSNSNSSVRGRARNGFVRPRAHSMRGFSRAKLKTVKLTFVVIVAYLFCWSPFFISQLWWMYDPSQEDNKAVVIMVLLGSLNSCCNPWIYLAFSGNLLRHLVPCCRHRPHCCAPCARSRNPAHYVTPSPTPSGTEPRGIRMVALLGRRKERQYGGIRMTLQGRGGRRYDVSEESQQNMVSRHALRESLTSLLTMRLSRHSSPQVQRSATNSSPGRDGRDCAVQVEVEKQRSPSSGGGGGGGGGGDQRRLPALPSKDASGTVASNCSSSSSSGGSSGKPRSPHVHKRARLHERPAEEVVEAQMKWEHNMGLKRPASQLLSVDGPAGTRTSCKASEAPGSPTTSPDTETHVSSRDDNP